MMQIDEKAVQVYNNFLLFYSCGPHWVHIERAVDEDARYLTWLKVWAVPLTKLYKLAGWQVWKRPGYDLHWLKKAGQEPIWLTGYRLQYNSVFNDYHKEPKVEYDIFELDRPGFFEIVKMSVGKELYDQLNVHCLFNLDEEIYKKTGLSML